MLRHDSVSIASLGGWVGGAFLLGIALHSFWPYQNASFSTLSLCAFIVTTALVFFWRTVWVRVVLICLVACLIGVWRFESVRAFMPRGLIPLNPRGLVHTQNNSSPINQPGVIGWLAQGRRELSDRARDIFPGDEAVLLTGILYGDRGLSKTIQQNFRQAGLLHIIAVSGSNVTIVVVLIARALLAFRRSRRFTFGVLSVSLIVFVLFVNPSASVVRAALMGWLVELAPLVGRIPRPSRLLLVTAVAFVTWQPWALLYDASFALSFLAMWGLLAWSPLIDEKIKTWLPWDQPRSILAATISATIMVTPYAAWAFGQLTMWGLVTSLVVLPLIPWTMLMGSLALLLPNLSLLVWSARGFLEIILWVARWPSIIPFGAWQQLSTPAWLMTACYACVYLLWRSLQPKKSVIHTFSRPQNKKM